MRGLLQVRENPLPLDPIIILQGVPNDLASFLNGPLQIIKHQIISLALGNPRDSAPQEEPDVIELSECLTKWLIKEALHRREGFPWTEIPSFDKKLLMMLAVYRHPC